MRLAGKFEPSWIFNDNIEIIVKFLGQKPKNLMSLRCSSKYSRVGGARIRGVDESG